MIFMDIFKKRYGDSINDEIHIMLKNLLDDGLSLFTKSVGEKYSPLPSLSFGASVLMICPDSRCLATVLKWSLYLISNEFINLKVKMIIKRS